MVPSEGSARYLGRSYLSHLFNALFYLKHLDSFGKNHADKSGITYGIRIFSPLLFSIISQ